MSRRARKPRKPQSKQVPVGGRLAESQRPIGWLYNVEMILARKIRRETKAVFRAAIGRIYDRAGCP